MSFSSSSWNDVESRLQIHAPSLKHIDYYEFLKSDGAKRKTLLESQLGGSVQKILDLYAPKR